MNIEYKPIRPDEYEPVRLFLTEMGWQRRVVDKARFGQMMRNSDRTVVAWRGAEVVGFGRALCDDVSNGYISMVAVAAHTRGLGIGTQIVRQLMGDDPEITWVVRAGRETRAFWEKAGYSSSQIAMERTRNG